MIKIYPKTLQSNNLRLARNVFMLLFFLHAAGSTAQTFPTGFSQVQVVNGLSNPTVLAFASDGRIFIAEQSGRLKVVKNGVISPTPFIQLSVNSSGERGLIGIALDPSFASNGYVYLYYTLPDASRNRISRFTANGDVVLAGSEKVILDLDPLSSATNHNGGAMQFGSDGKLYIAIGDNARGANSQDLDTYHGKLIRINPDGTVPSGNPFASGSEQRKRVWGYGLRNPYTFDVLNSNGKIFVNDVGQNTWEEINDATTGGRNFGWPSAEGNSSNTAYTNPVFAYSHGSGDGKGCAITGGVFFNPSSTNYPSSYAGAYFYQDLCNAWINYLTFDGSGNATRHSFATGLPGQSLAIETGADGNLYYLSRNAGALYKILYTPSNPPIIISQPSNVTVSQGESATFTVVASGTAPLNYQWRKNGTNISGANASSYTLNNAQPTDAAQYSVVVTNNFGSVTSNSAVLSVSAFNAVPVATITSPSSNSTYIGGQTISFSGTATDPEDGNLPASSFTWTLVFHHDNHVHDGPPIVQGVKSGSFTIPNSGETSHNVFYRLYLVVVDSKGLIDSAFVDIDPVKIQLSLATQPSGLKLTLDGQQVTAPFTTTAVAGIERSIGVVASQVINGSTYVFDRWSHGGALLQTITTPSSNTTYTAIFTEENLRNPDNPSSTVNGLEFSYFEGSWTTIPDFSSLTPVTTGTSNNFDLSLRNRSEYFGFSYSGFIEIPTDGVYTFFTSSDDGSKLFIGSAEVVNNDGLHGTRERSGTIGLKAGKHLIKVLFFERTGNQVLEVRYSGPGITKTFIPSSALFMEDDNNLRDPENPINAVNGLNYDYFEGVWSNLPAFDALTPLKTGFASSFDLSPRNRNDNFGFSFSGYIQIPADGIYTFFTNSDDGSKLYIGSTEVVDNDGLHALREISGTIGLKAGKHSINVVYFERTGGQILTVSFQGPGISKTIVDPSALFRINPNSDARITLETTNQANLPFEISMFPNPAKEFVRLAYFSEVEGEVIFSIVDLSGKQVKQFKRLFIKGSNELNIDLSDINSGVYHMIISDNLAFKINKLVINK